MNSTATQIAKIISTPNPSAPITTHALAELGNGSMQNGLRSVFCQALFPKKSVRIPCF